ncbi:ferritin family protein [Desulfosporosinus sp. BG]|uniref:ferritin family protein n=1 Tax=Desulfosporosinus sp. BG TaxID=1633135 RepID=UPI00083A807E|nr:ferritin family protein [Desulfosporosinus sp. BG]ODA39318.1 Rubrerythrin [Desulfosporosinus sp. BG]
MSWSLINFSGEEIIELALEMERSGKTFYEKAVTHAEGAKLKEMLAYLAKEEEQHIADFGRLAEKLSKEFVPNESYVGEYGDYLRAMINSHIFNLSNVEDIVQGIKSNREILQLALSFEKDSILIFQEFENFVEKAGNDVIKQLINEEKGHIKKINLLFREI